jgi:hypothetical protein
MRVKAYTGREVAMHDCFFVRARQTTRNLPANLGGLAHR